MPADAVKQSEGDDQKDKSNEKRRTGCEGHRPIHALGIKVGPNGVAGRKAIEHTGDDSIVYLVGKQVAIFSYEMQSHRFIPMSSKTIEIVAFAVSFNKRYIALSERVLEEKTGEIGIQVSVFNFGTVSRIRTLSLSYLNKYPVETLCFSRDNKYLVTVTAPPEPFIYLWQLDKARLLGMSELHVRVNCVSISPWAHWTMCTTGDTSLKLWKYQEKQIRFLDPLPKKTEYHFTCQAWFDDEKLAAGTQEGDVLIIDNTELKRVLPNVFGHLSHPPSSSPNKRTSDEPEDLHGPHSDSANTGLNTLAAVWTIYSVGRGFACGGENGNFTLYERTYDSDYFQCYKRFATPHPHRIIDITVSPNEETLLCCYANNELVHFCLANVDIMDHEKPEEIAHAFRLLPVGFHSDDVTAFDVCIQKSILITASMDKHVRVWNFIKKRLEIRKQFQEEVLSLSCHPTGTRLLLGFKYRMCMYNILADNLHPCQEFPIKQCREVRFSHGGHYFAAVVVNRIFIFNAYSFDPVSHLTGHSSMVKSFCWSKSDQTIISAGFEGAIFEWKTDTCKRQEGSEYTCKAISYSAVCYDEATQQVVAVGSHNKVAESETRTAEGDITLRVVKLSDTQEQEPPRSIAHLGSLNSQERGTSSKHNHGRAQTSEVAISTHAGALFVGTPVGELQIFSWPMKQSTTPIAPDLILDIHQGEILFVVLSTDEKYLFTVGEDGCLLMFDVDTLLDNKVPAGRRTFNYSIFDDVALVLHQDIDDKNREASALQVSLVEEQRTRKVEKENIISHYTQQLEQSRADAESKLQKAKLQKAEALRNLELTEKTMTGEAKAIEAQRLQDIQELEALHSRKNKDQHQRYEALLEEKNDLTVRYENKIHKMQKEREAEKKRATQELSELQQTLHQEVDKAHKERNETLEESTAILRDTEQEHEEEMLAREKRLNARLETKEKERLRAQSEVDGYRRRQEKHDVHIKELEREALDKKEKLRKKDAKIAELEKAIQALRLEINVRNDTISASEKKILELKKQTAELEKLRYVLQFRFNELRKEVVPKEDNIRAMNDRIQQMDCELERVGLDRDTLQQLLAAKDDKLDVIMKDVLNRNRRLDDRQRLLQLLLKELTTLTDKGDSKDLIYSLRGIVDKYSEKFGKQGEQIDNQKSGMIFERQRFYMEAQLTASKKQNTRREEHMKQDGQRKTGENSRLVSEINDLRHQKKMLWQKVQITESQLKEVRQSQRISLTPLPKKSRTPEPNMINRPFSPDGTSAPPKSSIAGKIQKGSTTSGVRNLSQISPSKIADIIQQVDKNSMEMSHQQEEIQRLRDFVQHLLKKIQQYEPTAGQASLMDRPVSRNMINEQEPLAAIQ